jgi:hypothetical protein
MQQVELQCCRQRQLYPWPPGESQTPAETPQEPPCILFTAACLLRKLFYSVSTCICSMFICVRLVSLPCLPMGIELCMGEGWEVAKDTGSTFWGPVGQARVGSHSRRKGHSEVGREASTPPSYHHLPALPPASKEKGTLRGRGM